MREKLGSVFCMCFFLSKKCSIDGFFTVNSMILIEYGFVIAGSEIREKKEFFYIASFISFCLGGFPVSRFFHIENVVVVGSKKVVKTDDIYLLLSLLQFVGDVGMKLVMHFHQSSNIFGVDSESLLLQVGSSCQGGRDVRLDRLCGARFEKWR